MGRGFEEERPESFCLLEMQLGSTGKNKVHILSTSSCVRDWLQLGGPPERLVSCMGIMDGLQALGLVIYRTEQQVLQAGIALSQPERENESAVPLPPGISLPPFSPELHPCRRVFLLPGLLPATRAGGC